MADGKDIQNQKDFNKEVQNQISLEKELLNLLSKRAGIDADILSDQQDIANVIRDQTAQLKFQNEEKRNLRSLSNQITKISKEAYSISVDELGLAKTNNDLAKKQAQLTNNILLLDAQKKDLAKDQNDLNNDLVQTINEQIEAAQKLEKNLNKIAQQSNEIADDFGVKTFGGISDIVKKIPGLSKFSGPFEDAAEAARSTATSNLLASKKASSLAAGFKSLGSSLTKALGPAAVLAAVVSKLVEAFKIIDGRAGDTAKNLGISYQEAQELNAEMTQVAVSSNNLLISSKDMIEAQMQLNNAFGTSVKLSGEFVSDFALIQERTGLSGKAMEMFATQATIAGNNTKDQLQSVSDVTMQLNQQSGITLNMKEIQEGIAELSNDQLLTNRLNTGEMANQVFQQKLLGISASQLEQTQSNLLDFESSIGAELEAELLTGKQLNLERARAAALAGDQATLAKEIAEQVGTAAEYEEMNVIQRQALAKAFGMTRDELAGMLIEQEKMNALRAAGLKSASVAQEAYNSLIDEGFSHEEALNELRLSGQDDLLGAQLKSTSQQEKLAAITEKLTDLFIKLVDPLIPFIEKMVNFVVSIEPFLGAITGALAGAAAGTAIAPGIGTAIGAIAGLAGGGILQHTELATGGIVTKPTRALIGEAGEPEAVVPLSKAPQLGFGGGTNNETNALLRELITAVKSGGDVYMDGAKVGKSIALATSRIG